MDEPQPQAIVIGRIGADLYPLQIGTPLERVRTFERFVGGFAGNVATGLARLGVRVSIVSAVGDDGHGRFVRDFLSGEGVDVRWLGTHPTLRTALAFCEAWPPDHFPITFYREPTCPDWELTTADIPMEAVRSAPLVLVTGTGLAREPSRAATLAALEARDRASTTIFDLDWRQVLWREPAEYAALAARAAWCSTVLVGGDAEFAAARIDPQTAIETFGISLAVVKHGAAGATLHARESEITVPGLEVPVVNGLGAGDAFVAAFAAALLAGLSGAEGARRGNAAGAIVASRLACAPAMARSDEIDALLEGATVHDGVVTMPR